MMKKNVIVGFLALLMLSACQTGRETVSSVDDAYAVPSEVRAAERAAAAEQAKQEALAREKNAGNNNVVNGAQKEPVDVNNPKYRDQQYSSDDYYDYAYASRLNRFHHPMGLGYYDAYYTNMYTYSGNPALYGSSIYAGSMYNMPMGGYNGWSIGMSSGYGYGFGGACACGPYGFGSPYYDPWMGAYGYPYAGGPYFGGGYGYGYNSPYMNYWGGYNAGFNNGNWSYFNSLDANSSYSQLLNAPRVSNGGGNRNPSGGQVNSGGQTNNQRTYLQEVAEQQQTRQRFNAVPNDRVMNRSRNEPSGTQRQSTTPANPSINNQNNTPVENNNRRGAEQRNKGRVIQNQEPQAQPQRRETPVIQPGGGGGNQGGRGSDGGSSPRNSGGGRPR